jgi:hypothetical protein
MRATNPATEEIVGEYPDHTPIQVTDLLRQFT